MSRSQKILFFGLLLVLAGMVYMEATKKQPVNWFPSYHKTDKIPLGTFVLHDLMEENFAEKFIEKNQPPFEVLKDSTLSGTYFFVNDDAGFDEDEFERLYKWAEKGNTIFIAASYLSNTILDTLKLKQETAYSITNLGTKPMLNLVNKNLKSNKPYLIDRDFQINYLSEIDTLNQTVLGVTQVFNDTLKITKPQVNFIKAPIGKGAIYIHSQPEAFTNYFLLDKENAAYTQNVLSYINDGKNVYWDNYYKTGKPVNMSLLKILLGSKYLKWAYYFVLIGALLFIFFEGKRKQRSIAVVEPLTNKTYDYTRTISGMYIDKKENHQIAQKQISLFFEYIRIRLRIPTDLLAQQGFNSRFVTSVAARSGNTVEETKEVLTLVEKIQNQQNTSAEELQLVYNKINDFKHKTDGKSRNR